MVFIAPFLSFMGDEFSFFLVLISPAIEVVIPVVEVPLQISNSFSTFLKVKVAVLRRIWFLLLKESKEAWSIS